MCKWLLSDKEGMEIRRCFAFAALLVHEGTGLIIILFLKSEVTNSRIWFPSDQRSLEQERL
jgi:hypothetical protein